MTRETRGDNSADNRVAYRDGCGFEPVEVDRGVQAQVENNEEDAECCECQGERTHRPSQPRGGAALHPTNFSTLFPCPFCHNTTLQQDRLPSVTRWSGERTSENAQKAKFAESQFSDVGWIEAERRVEVV